MHIDQTAQEMSVIGVDVSLEHLDIRCLPCGTSMRLSNDGKDHDKLVALPWPARPRGPSRTHGYPEEALEAFENCLKGEGVDVDKKDKASKRS